jgi:carboxymethylenebutenolidase
LHTPSLKPETMKKILLPLLLLLYISAVAQHPKSCCSISATEQFAMLGSSEEFAALHPDPIPFNFIPAKGTMITFPTMDGKDANAFEVKSGKPTDNWIIMIHEWWGLNDYIKQEAEKLQREVGNVNILAIDLYDGKVATTAADAQKFMGELKQERAVAILKGAIADAGQMAQIYTIGWCMGGGWSLQAALLAGKQANGCVMYYGMPEKDVNKLKNLNCDVLGLFAKKDDYITPEIVAQFEKDMKAAGKKIIVKEYDAVHAFANPSNPKYDKEAAADAHDLVLDFLKARIK